MSVLRMGAIAMASERDAIDYLTITITATFRGNYERAEAACSEALGELRKRKAQEARQ